LENAYFDTYRYAKELKKNYGWENVKLEYLSQQFGISQPDAHRAWCDAEANVGVYFELQKLWI
jgi:DNA polymerase III epsilon subunit-like protein